jgi:hypothetical protein
MSYENEDELSQRINQRLARLRWLFVHLAITIVVAVGLSLAMERMAVPDYVEAIIPTVVLLFIAHAFGVMWFEAKRFIVQQETAAYQTEMPEKAKHDDYVGVALLIGDDGELVEFSEEETRRAQGRET